MNAKIRIIISVVVGVALAALIAFAQTRTDGTQSQSAGGIIGMPLGGSFEGLLDANGKTVTEETFKDKYQLVFFGFTFCPMICPTEMTRLGKVLDKLTPDQRAQLAPIFVSIDPERDTPKVLKAYGTSFNPAIISLTGTPDAINKVKADWKVYASKVQMDGMTEYMMDHSTFLYFRGPDGLIQGLFNREDSPETILKAINAVIK